MLKKIVNGEEFVLSDEEERVTLMYWKMNEAHPEYASACCFDGVKEPWYDLDEVRKIKMKLIDKAKIDLKDELTDTIDELEDEGKDASDYRKQRAELRSYCPDLSKLNTFYEIEMIRLPLGS
jgi:hypothetical protein